MLTSMLFLFLLLSVLGFCYDLSEYVIREGDILVPKESAQEGFHTAQSLSYNRQWKNGKVFFVFHEELSRHERSEISAAMREMEEKTCIRFHYRGPEKGYVKIVKGDGCYSEAGRNGSEQLMSIGESCLNRRTILHELMHALGFFHEHSHPDRDTYIQIHRQNIKPFYLDQIRPIHRREDLAWDTEYSYTSIMHYTETEFLKEELKGKGLKTISAKKAFKGNMGGENRLSDVDVERINKYYCRGRNAGQEKSGSGGFHYEPRENGQIMMANGCNMPHYDDFRQELISYHECPRICADDYRCTHVVWGPEHGGKCWLKSGLPLGTLPESSDNLTYCGYKAANPKVFNWKPGQGTIVWTDGCNFSGAKAFQQKYCSKEQCVDLCYKHSSCTHFSHVEEKCYLKNGIPTGTAPQKVAGYSCGFKKTYDFDWKESRVTQLLSASGCNYFGYDYHQEYDKTSEECEHACSSDPPCTHYHWNIVDRKCWLKKNVPDWMKPVRVTYGCRCGYKPSIQIK